MALDSRPANTPEEWEAHFQDFLTHLDNLTEEEKRAVDEYGVPNSMRRWRDRTTWQGYIYMQDSWPAIRGQIAEAVRHMRNDARSRAESEELEARLRAEHAARTEAADTGQPDPVLAQIRAMDQGDTSLFTRSGKPRCSALRKMLGRVVSAQERDQLWSDAIQ